MQKKEYILSVNMKKKVNMISVHMKREYICLVKPAMHTEPQPVCRMKRGGVLMPRWFPQHAHTQTHTHW